MKSLISLSALFLLLTACCEQCPEPPKCPECKFSGPIVNPDNYDLFYMLSSDGLQTFQFQACDKLFYSTVGKFYGTQKSDTIFELKGIQDMEILTLMSNQYFEGKRLDIQNVTVDRLDKNTVKFYYDIQLNSLDAAIPEVKFNSKNDSDNPFPFDIMKGAKIEFIAQANDEVMKKSCMSVNGFDGGGYECNGFASF